ncbi:MAG TPA: hypothetical protein VL970_05795, partial [Candidatus Acidoferrales bacterium]|nr:hypothetical protein [Candidatus Acidoferrales bacterium]
QIVVSNAGPYSVTNVCATNVLPGGFYLLSVNSSQGTIATNGQALVFALGPISTNSSAALSLTFAMDTSLVDTVTNATVVTDQVSAAASDLPDAVPFNNSAAPQLLVTPRDSNHDGIPDYWCLFYGFNPNDTNTATEDSAGDGISNLQKYLAGLNPFTFYGMRISGWSFIQPSSLCLRIHAAVGATYSLQASSNLVQWSTLFSFLCQSTNQAVQSPVDPSSPQMFYRLAGTTNPPTPILVLSNPAGIATNALPILQIEAPPGYPYSVDVSTNLADWTLLTNYDATIWDTQVIDVSASGAPVRFYRASFP